MVQRIPLANGKGFARISDHRAALVAGYSWRLKREPCGVCYAVAYIPGSTPRRQITMHNLIMGRRRIDHWDGDGLNNTDGNLRDATNGQNMANRKPNRRGCSPFKGVTWHRPTSQWRARLQVDGQRLHLGLFTCEEDAARAYDEAALTAWGAYARLNFPR